MSTLKSPNRDSIQKIQEVLGTIPPKHIYTRMKSIKNGILITLSNLGGCPKENYKGDGLTQTPCKNSFYQAISKFLKKNKNNRVVFMGNFFGNGPYVMTVMFNIMLLIQEFNYTDGKSRTELGDKQVEIVLGDKDINIWRCKYELHKTLLQQDINIPELDIEMPSMVKFTKKEGSQDKVFGDYIPYNSRIEKDFSRITTTAIVNSLFHRMMKILKTCGCHIPDCFLFNHNFSELYYLAKNEQNIELMVLVQQLSVFVLVYPFAPKKRYEPYIYEGEIFNIIEHILFKIEDIILEFRSYRTDIYVRRMYEINNRIKMLLANSDTKVHLEEVLPLKNWSNVLVHFYDNASLIHYDEKFGTIFSKYDPNYCLPLFFNTFLSYSKYVENDPQKEFKEKPKTEGNIWSIENYYERYKKIYLKFLCLKLVNRVSNSKNHPYQDFLNKKVSGERELGEMSSSNDMGDFSNSNINNSNGGGKSKKSAMTLKKKRKHNNTISLKKSLKRNRYERIKGGGIDYDELSVCTGFDSIIFNSGIVPLGKIYKLDIKNNRYSELNIHFECRYINRIFREICKYPATLQNDKELNLFLFIQSFYTFMRKNRRRQSPFNGRHVRQNKDLYDMLKFKKIYNIVVGDYDLNLSFDLPIINFYGVSFIFCDKVNETKKKFATARKAKITHDNYDDYSDNELLKIYNYPLIAINMEGDFEHTSLTISGNLKIKKTFLGKYYFHTFRNFFLLHEPLTDVKLMEYKNNFVINAETNYHKLEVYMLPLFRTDNLNQYPKTFFIDNMYFIKLFDATPELKEMFMIIDMEYALKGGKIGTYLGNITQWLGFFWDGKRLYRRKIKNIPNTIKDLQTFLKYYLPAMTTNILNLPLTEPIDIELKKEKSLLKNNYKLYRELKNKDFMSLRELERLLHKKNDCPDDDMLDRLKKMFEMIFHSKNMRPKKYKLNYHQLSDNDEFELGITIEEKIKKKEVLLPVNNVDAYKGTLLGKGRFKKIFPYDRRDVVTTKQRFVVSDERKNKFTDKYFKEVSLLIFASFQESTPKYSPYIVHLRCLNIWENDFYYLIPRSFLGSLDQVLNDGGKINGKDFLTSGKNISNVNFYNLMLQICQAILYLHDKFLLHLDLYERNILIYENQGQMLFQLNDLGYGEVNLGKQVEMNKSNIMEFVEARNTNFNEDSYFYEFNNGFGYTKLKIVECPNTQKNYRITNYISKGVPSMSCPIAVQDRFNIFGNQTDMWSYGYIFIKIICQMYSTLHPEEHCKNFSSIKSSSGKYGKIKEIFKVINFYTASNLATLEGETKINAINLLYYLLVNPIQKKNIVSYPQPDYLESEIYIDSKFSDLQETKPGKGEYQMINKLLLNQISEEEELLFHKSEKITLGLTEDTMKLMHLCLVNWCQRVEFTDMLDFLQKHKDFKTMGTFIIPQNVNLPILEEKIIKPITHNSTLNTGITMAPVPKKRKTLNPPLEKTLNAFPTETSLEIFGDHSYHTMLDNTFDIKIKTANGSSVLDNTKGIKKYAKLISHINIPDTKLGTAQKDGLLDLILNYFIKLVKELGTDSNQTKLNNFLGKESEHYDFSQKSDDWWTTEFNNNYIKGFTLPILDQEKINRNSQSYKAIITDFFTKINTNIMDQLIIKIRNSDQNDKSLIDNYESYIKTTSLNIKSIETITNNNLLSDSQYYRFFRELCFFKLDNLGGFILDNSNPYTQKEKYLELVVSQFNLKSEEGKIPLLILTEGFDKSEVEGKYPDLEFISQEHQINGNTEENTTIIYNKADFNNKNIILEHKVLGSESSETIFKEHRIVRIKISDNTINPNFILIYNIHGHSKGIKNELLQNLITQIQSDYTSNFGNTKAVYICGDINFEHKNGNLQEILNTYALRNTTGQDYRVNIAKFKIKKKRVIGDGLLNAQFYKGESINLDSQFIAQIK